MMSDKPSPAAAPSILKRVSEAQYDDRHRVLVFGRPGAGKTSLAGSFPRPVIIDTDLKASVLRSKWYQDFNPGADPFVETFYDEVDEHGLFKSADAFLNIAKFITRIMKEARDQFDTIVIDSLTSTQGLAMNLGLELAAKRRGSKTLTQARARDGIPIALPSQGDYGAEMQVMEQFMNQLIALPKHIVCTAHERQETNDSGQVLSVEPYLIGARIRSLIGTWFEDIWYLDSNNKRERVLYTQSDHRLKCVETRWGVPHGLINPTYTKIIKEVAR